MEKSLSKDRFSRYLAATNGDREKAICLYAWNAAVSATFYAPLQALEVTLRNQIHEHLTEKYGVQWYDHSSMKFDDKKLEQLKTAKSKLEEKSTPIRPPDMVAEHIRSTLQ